MVDTAAASYQQSSFRQGSVDVVHSFGICLIRRLGSSTNKRYVQGHKKSREGQKRNRHGESGRESEGAMCVNTSM